MKTTILNILGILFLIFIVAIYFLIFQDTGVLSFDSSFVAADSSNKIFKILITIIPMIIGIFFSALYNQIKDINTSINYKNELNQMIKSPHLLKSLLLAPLILTGIFAFAGTSPSTLTTLLFSFQNGFFCESILKGKKSEN